MQPFAGMKDSWIAEYTMKRKLLCVKLNDSKILPDSDGMIFVLERPGIGISFSINAITKYLVDVEIIVNKKVLYFSPSIQIAIKKLFVVLHICFYFSKMI